MIAAVPSLTSLIRQAMEKSGLTQVEAAKRFGVTTRTFRRWESGEVVPQGDSMLKFLKMFQELGLPFPDSDSSAPSSESPKRNSKK